MGNGTSEQDIKMTFESNFLKGGTYHNEVNRVDIVIHTEVDPIRDINGNEDVEKTINSARSLLYIEAKRHITSDSARRKAYAQAVLTNKLQPRPINKLGVLYLDGSSIMHLDVINISDDNILYNDDINWDSEKPSNPSEDAINRINDRISGNVQHYREDIRVKEDNRLTHEIRDFINSLFNSSNTKTDIKANNILTVFNEWKSYNFFKGVDTDTLLVELFLTDIRGNNEFDIKKTLAKKGIHEFGTKSFYDEEKSDCYYSKFNRMSKYTLDMENYKITYTPTAGISTTYEIIGEFARTNYNNFWSKYNKVRLKEDYEAINENINCLYDFEHRRKTGAEYTPECLVELQNETLKKLGYNLEDYIIIDTCAGVGNLENKFPQHIKDNCYLSTLEPHDADIMKSNVKGFENVVDFDYLNGKSLEFMYNGKKTPIDEIIKDERNLGKKVMIIINPPYAQEEGNRNNDNLAIQFFNNLVKQCKPDAMVFYYMLKSFDTPSELESYKKSEFKIACHNVVNAKIFGLAEWGLSQIFFDKEKGEEIDEKSIKFTVYDTEKSDNGKNVLIPLRGNEPDGRFSYNLSVPSLFEDLKTRIDKNRTGVDLGHYTEMSDTLGLYNLVEAGKSKPSVRITSDNLLYTLTMKGILYCTTSRFYERNKLFYRGTFNDLPKTTISDAVFFSLFYKNTAFSNKEGTNVIEPFTAKELECTKNALRTNVQDVQYIKNKGRKDYRRVTCDGFLQSFDFRVFLDKVKEEYGFSPEARDLYNYALMIFKYFYREYYGDSTDVDHNYSFDDIKKIIMGWYDSEKTVVEEDESEDDTAEENYVVVEDEDHRRTIHSKTSKGKTGFSRFTYKSRVPESEHWYFEKFFDARDTLIKKINKDVYECGVLPWEKYAGKTNMEE